MSVLLDTNVLVWAALNPARLSTSARTILTKRDETKFVSPLSIYEIAQKSAIGKLELPVPVAAFVQTTVERLGAEYLSLTGPHLSGIDRLPGHHKDPFDRLLTLQALAEGIPILSPDRLFDLYGVQRIW